MLDNVVVVFTGELPEVDTEIETEVGTGAAAEDVPMEMAV